MKQSAATPATENSISNVREEIDPAWAKRDNGQRITILVLWRTLPAEKFEQVADLLYLGLGR